MRAFSLALHSSTTWNYYLHLPSDIKEAQRGGVTCPELHSASVADRGLPNLPVLPLWQTGSAPQHIPLTKGSKEFIPGGRDRPHRVP